MSDIRKPLPGEHTTWSQHKIHGYCWLMAGHAGPHQSYGHYVCSMARDAGHCGEAEVIAEYRSPYGREFDPTWDWPPFLIHRVESKMISMGPVTPMPMKGGLTAGVFFMDFGKP